MTSSVVSCLPTKQVVMAAGCLLCLLIVLPHLPHATHTNLVAGYRVVERRNSYSDTSCLMCAFTRNMDTCQRCRHSRMSAYGGGYKKRSGQFLASSAARRNAMCGCCQLWRSDMHCCEACARYWVRSTRGYY